MSPYAKIVADWQPGSLTRRVIVFTNCEEAILTLNGKEIARAKPEKHAATKYEDAKPFDGSNTNNLVHPPIIFPAINYKAGTLRVVAIKAKEQTTDEIKTAGEADHVKVWIDDQGVPAGRNDLVFVRAAVVDQNGTVCLTDSRRIHFLITGASLAGESDVNCEMGIASALIRTPLDKSSVRITATGASLKGSTLKLDIF